MSNTTATRRAKWVEPYRSMTAVQLADETRKLRTAVLWGYATEAELRFEVLEAEQARRSESVTTVDLERAHEQAHRENERRWATEQEKCVAEHWENAEDAAIIAELAVRVIRYWRLSREAGQPVAFGKYSRLCSLAAEELERECGYEVRKQSDGGWKLAPVQL
jgi:hypothetical protein